MPQPKHNRNRVIWINRIKIAREMLHCLLAFLISWLLIINRYSYSHFQANTFEVHTPVSGECYALHSMYRSRSSYCLMSRWYKFWMQSHYSLLCSAPTNQCCKRSLSENIPNCGKKYLPYATNFNLFDRLLLQSMFAFCPALPSYCCK